MTKLSHQIIVITLLCCSVSPQLAAKSVYQEPEAFINGVFPGELPEVRRLWIKKELKPKVKAILGHELGSLRVRYWERDQRTAWILEEIGKYKYITVGIVINKSKIETTKVLIFRESRGWEVKYPFFTDQYKDTRLSENLQLTKKIDGISGATLSVTAVTKLVRLALLLHQHADTRHSN